MNKEKKLGNIKAMIENLLLIKLMVLFFGLLK